MSGSSPPRSWQEIRSALADYSGIIAFVVWAVAGLLWLAGMIPVWLALILVGVAGTFTIIGIMGQVLIGGGEPLTTLGSLLPSLEVSGQVKKTSTAKQSKIFRNRARQPQPIRNLRGKLTFRDAETGKEFPTVDRAVWVKEKYNAITLEVDDSRLLLIGFALPPTHTNPRFVFVMSNNYYEGNTDGTHVVHQIVSSRLVVDVRLVAGNSGIILYEGSFQLDTTPRLILSERTTN